MPTPTFFNLKSDKKDKIIEAIINELSRVNYEYINIQNIIRNANIPRGSYYQYFINKEDMYTYIMTYIGEKKMVYFKGIFEDANMEFIDRIEALYLAGLRFKNEYSQFVKVGERMMSSKLYQNNEVIQEGLIKLLNLYESWISIDQGRGVIRSDINPKHLAELVMNLLNRTTVMSFIEHKYDEFEWENQLILVLDILKKGVLIHV